LSQVKPNERYDVGDQMQLRTKWAVLALAILLLSSVGTTGLVLAQSNSSAPVAQTSASLPATLQKEPLNPAFVQYQQNKSAGKVATQTVDGLGLGWVPPPYELSKAPTATSLAQAQAYPATYDLRTLNKVSPVENQGDCGSCWTFATFGSLESYLLPGLTTTYSENNLKNFADFDYTCCARRGFRDVNRLPRPVGHHHDGCHWRYDPRRAGDERV
jgi:C1A family cysteine protease